MNEEQLRNVLGAATAGIEPRDSPFGPIAAAGQHRHRRKQALAAVVAVAVLSGGAISATALAPGDRGGGTIETVDGPSTTTPSTTAPTTTTPTTAAPPTTTSLPIATTLPARPVSRPASNGDIDGDGVSDTATIQATSDPQVGLVRARLSALGDQEVRTDAFERESLAVMGIHDIDGDGFGEVFLRVGRGASTVSGSLLRLVDGRLILVGISRDAGDWVATFPLHGSVTHLNSLTCLEEARQLMWTEAYPSEPDASSYELHSVTMEFDGANLESVSDTFVTVPAERVPSVLTCDGIPKEW